MEVGCLDRTPRVLPAGLSSAASEGCRGSRLCVRPGKGISVADDNSGREQDDRKA